MRATSARRWVALALEGAALGWLAFLLLSFAWRSRLYEWDARSYLLAARAALAGLDPYSIESLRRVSGGHPVSLPFVYPPIGLVPFLPLAPLALDVSLTLWIAIKLGLLAWLVILWRRIAPSIRLAPLALLAVFGFGATTLWDLSSGNVALVEAFLVWRGLDAFVRGRRGAFAAWIVAASCFKLTPAAFLLLLLVPAAGRAPSPVRLAAALATLVALIWIPFWIGPARQWTGFLANLRDPLPVGRSDPGLLALFLDYARAAYASEAAALRAALGAWLVTSLLILGLSARWLIAAWRAGDARRWAFAASWLFVLLAPRPMAYGFVLAVPAPLALPPRGLEHRIGAWVLALVLSLQGILFALHRPVRGSVVQFAPVLLGLALWLLMVRHVGRAPAPALGEAS
jgi:Glycosyltransferase family 87